jgi:hypothetical protein
MCGDAYTLQTANYDMDECSMRSSLTTIPIHCWHPKTI